jgi:hypothetical protein
MAVVPVFESFSGPSHDYLHENIMGLMLIAVALCMILWQPLSSSTIAGVAALLVALANVIFAAAIASFGWFVIGVIEGTYGIVLLYIFWRNRTAVRSAAAAIVGRRLQSGALIAAVVAASPVAYAYSAQHIDPRLWYGGMSLAMVAIGMGTAVILEKRRAIRSGIVAVVVGAIVLLPFYGSLLS